MRIALDATYSVDRQPTGIAVYSREILNGLAKSFPDDTFLQCFRPKQFRQAGVVGRNVRKRLLLPLWTGRSDLFHALNQRLDRRWARHTVTTFHDLFVMTGDYSSSDFRARFTQQARRAADHSDVIIAVSHFTASQVTSLLGVEPARIRVIPHGAHPVTVSPGKREKIVLSVGAIQKRKNVMRLVKAFETLPNDWTLVLAGAATGFGSAEILAGIEQNAARGRIQVTGYLSPEQLDALYGRASIFAFPSLDEGFGIPVLEAMAHGLPVVTSNVSALPEVAGDAAILVDPAKVEEIAGALQLLVESEQERKRLGGLGCARAELYPWQRAVDATHRVYQEL